jgi:hypothetical protein
MDVDGTAVLLWVLFRTKQMILVMVAAAAANGAM